VELNDVTGAKHVEELEQYLEYSFRNLDLIHAALMHRSYAEENNIVSESARLAFMGDALLLFFITEVLFDEFPELEPGEMTTLRSELISRNHLYQWARELYLGEFIFLGRGEESLGGREKRSILAETMEAVLAAVFLDGGMEPVRCIVRGYFESEVDAVLASNFGKSAKAMLQEHVQRRDGNCPVYRVVEETGEPHKKTFVIEVLVEEQVLARGQGRSKKRAEESAARLACRELGL